MSWLTSALGAVGLYTPPPTTNPYAQQALALAQQQAPQVNGAQQAQFRQGQLQQIGQLQGVASGQQQGAGELAVQRQVANAQAANQAQATMARGGANAALAYRQAANNTAGVGLAGAGQAQQAALTDQQQAQGVLAQQLNQGRSQDLSLAGQNAQLQAGQNQLGANIYQGIGGQNLQAQQASANQANALTSGLLSAAGGAIAGGANLGAGYSYQGGGNPNGPPAGGGSSLGGLATLGAFLSDERTKTNVSDGGKAIDKMLDGIKARSYRYKDPANGKGQRVGVMAQDLAKSPIGAATTTPAATPEGPRVALDVNKAVSAALAASARLHQRVKLLEGKKAA